MVRILGNGNVFFTPLEKLPVIYYVIFDCTSSEKSEITKKDLLLLHPIASYDVSVRRGVNSWLGVLSESYVIGGLLCCLRIC